MKSKVKEEKLNSVLKKLYNVKGFYYGSSNSGDTSTGLLGGDITPVVGCVPSREENRCGGYGTIAHMGLVCDFSNHAEEKKQRNCPAGSSKNSWEGSNDHWGVQC